ncbi:Transcriptional regulator, GntR family [Serinicoccus hydrothermalis]|uniref:Transcriptional regulator, GntR family n=1 Tax=Serinicoccus hydrothermalis TaxID=1758689 RepID=A0A1B1N9B9_9MICO|nr:GntR family transcriptional regulator [Serinicoccus hydrothermalis]ANS78008.1 Transcriptional regulator, GntR family [Serinicoccus hydrothermalis]
MPIPSTPASTAGRRLLRDDVYGRIRDAIVRGRLAPGEKINDAELAVWLGVSRTPVREALLRLSRDGLVHARPGRVTTVAPEDETVLADAREVVAELHGLAVRSASARLGAEELDAMDEATARLREALEGPDPAAALQADDDFHAVPVRVAGNPILAAQLDAVTAMLRRAEFLHFGSLTGSDSPAEHDLIVRRLREGDVAGAVEATRANWLGLGRPRPQPAAPPR